ncbi:MAG: bifunctional biotin--[acetyl-CoA-carboxylase] ligase/biotin operon repressor BirA [Pseudohongiella sp.]|nr:bifunctional biotin--[acetyl-CoA-carboxylase] ligase/biotin operon repressor BirA [Pseudohongiella sp.]MDP2129133.1 bifunctional biotin--[acetyl-CoA-carboxylase] ligase/biotin operon repressor BirA [Pseudohongiella sp.]
MNLVPLLTLLCDGSSQSGEALGRRLGISRAAVWKQIHQLKELGVGIHAVTGKGYCIPGGLQLLDRQKIINGLDAGVSDLISGIDVHFTVGSTNTEAMSKAGEGYESYLVMTEHQSLGRGRRGRSWVSPFGHNLYLSMLWSFQGGIAALEGLSLVCALAVKRALVRQQYHDVGVKWPNDVLFERQKLAGILLEVSGDVSGPCKVVIGVGLNVDMPLLAGRGIDQPFSDLKAMRSEAVDRNRLAAVLVSELVAVIKLFQEEGFGPFQDDWLQADVYLGQAVEIQSGQNVLPGVCAGVDEVGRLLLETADGVQRIAGGEVMPSLRPVTKQ